MATVYGIVKEHGGEIKVHSELGRGSRFAVYLPLIERKPGAAAFQQASACYPTGDERILLIDDDEAVVRLEKQMLERLGYRVTACHGSVDARNLFCANPSAFDLVVTDMTMPQLTGDRLARAMIATRSDIPVIICTGFSERIDEKRAHEIGIKGFLMKPVIRSQLAAMVRNVLDAARNRSG